MAELITAIAGAIVGVGGLIFGIVKWHAANKKVKEQEAKHNIQQEVLTKIDTKIQPLIQNNEEIMFKLDRLQARQDDNERARIRTEIMDAIVELNGGLKLSDVNYQHLEAEYEKYKSLGGNSYIDHQMEIIRSYFVKK